MSSPRKTLASVVIVLVALLSFSWGLSWYLNEGRIPEFEELLTVYSSPEGGDSLQLGDWLYGSFQGPDVPDEDLVLSWRLDILSWGGCPDEMRFQKDLREMTIDEFEQMNETRKLELFAAGYSSISKPRTTYGYGSYRGPVEPKRYVWTVRFTDSEGNPGTQILGFRLSVVISRTI
jgi:hypothetical protein